MSEDLRKHQNIVAIKNTFVITTAEINEIPPREENCKESHEIKHIPAQETDQINYIERDNLEIIDTIHNEIIIDSAEAAEKLNSETKSDDVVKNRTDKSVNEHTMKFWIFPALFGPRKGVLNTKSSEGVEATDEQTDKDAKNTLGPKSHAVGWFKLGRPGLRDDLDDRDYEEIASYGSFVNERPSGPMYNPELHNYFIFYVFRMVVKMLLFTDVAFLVVNDFLKYPKWIQKYLKVDWPRRNFKKYGQYYMDVALMVYIFVTFAFYCGPCTRQKKIAKMAMIAGMLSVTVMAVSYYVINKFVDVVFSFYTTTIVALMCLLLARRQYRFTNPVLYLLCVVATLVPLIILYVLGTQYLRNIKYPDEKAKLKLVLLCLYQSMTMIVQIAMVTGHRAITYTKREVYFAAFQLYSAFWQVFITIIEIMGLIEIECE